VSGLWIRLAPRGALLLAATRLGHSAILPELPGPHWGAEPAESRLQSILAISVVSTKNASLQSQSHFDYDEATIR
jgi:hypothetical protein